MLKYEWSGVTQVFETREPAADSLPGVGRVLEALREQRWAYNARQIPATVIETGVLKHVPYHSFQCGRDYELNIYGDPESPAAVEVGFYGKVLDDPAARSYCRDFLLGLVRHGAFLSLWDGIDLQGGSKAVGEWTLEVTPSTAADAYGGWWIGVFSEARLGKVRASAEEMASLTVGRSKPKLANLPQLSWDPEEIALVRRAAYVPQPKVVSPLEQLRQSRAVAAPSYPSSGSGGGGTVYVRGYTRKDGTYVRGYSRRR